MNIIERGQSLQGASPAPVRSESHAAAAALASRLMAELDRAGGADPGEVGRILVELNRIPQDAQQVFFAAAAQGLVGGNPIAWVRDRISESFPAESEKRLRLGEVLARLHGADPKSMSQAALESIVSRVLSRLGPVVSASRPAPAPPKDEIEPTPDLGPFSGAPLLSPLVPLSAAAAMASVTATDATAAAAAPGTAPAREPFRMKILDVTIPTITPSSTPKKKKGGFLGKLLSIVSVVLTILQFIFPIYAIIFKMIQMAIAAYQAIKAKNLMGLVGAVASAVGGAGANVLSQAAGASAQVLSKVAEYAGTLMKAFQAYQALRKGDWLGALAGFGAAAAGLAQSWTGSAAEALKGFADKMQEVAGRLQTVVQVVAAARRGDFVGAIGMGASFAADLQVLDPAARQTLQQAAGLAEKLAPVQAALRQGDYLGAASRIVGIAGAISETPARQQLLALSGVLEKAGAAQQLVARKDYAGAAAVLGEVAATYVGPPQSRTKAQVEEAIQQLQLAARAYARGRAGDWTGAASELSRLASAYAWDNETRGHFLKGSLALRRASGIERALKNGRLKEAAGLLTDALSVFSDDVPDLARLVTQLEEAGRLYQATRHGDYARALLILKQIIEREAGRPVFDEKPPAPTGGRSESPLPRSDATTTGAAAAAR